MKKIIIALLLGSLFFGCSQDDSVEAKKEKLAGLKKQHDEIGFQIQELESELKNLDTTSLDSKKSGRLVTTLVAQKESFQKFIDIQGTAGSDLNVTLSAEVSGEVLSIPVNEGQDVKKGQLLAKIDDGVLLEEIEELKTSLQLATTVFERQEKLWKQNIGSELQYLERKNEKENLETRLKKAQTQLEKTRITAPVNGTVENIQIKVGEMIAPGTPLMNVVNLDEIIVKADVPERYIGSVTKGEEVTVNFPALGTERKAAITSVGSIINPRNRTFNVEIKIPNKDHALKANLLAIVKIIDYQNPDVVTLPTKLIQRTNGDDFVYLVENKGEDKVARRAEIKTGATYDGETEILSGIAAGDLVINEGAHDVSNGSLLDIQHSDVSE